MRNAKMECIKTTNNRGCTMYTIKSQNDQGIVRIIGRISRAELAALNECIFKTLNSDKDNTKHVRSIPADVVEASRINNKSNGE